MKKTIICSIPMKETVDLVTYASDDKSICAKEEPMLYPINAMIESAISKEDRLKVIMLVKKDKYGHYEKNADDFKREFLGATLGIASEVEFVMIDTAFGQSKDIHEQLMGRLVDEIDVSSHILFDMTYGPKDLPIVVFTALTFAENFLDCIIDNIVYGQASFVNGKPTDTKICDMSPLFYLSSVTNTIRCDDPEKARMLLKKLLSM